MSVLSLNVITSYYINIINLHVSNILSLISQLKHGEDTTKVEPIANTLEHIGTWLNRSWTSSTTRLTAISCNSMYLAGWGRCSNLVMGIAVILVILSAKVWAVHLPDSDFIPRKEMKQRSERDRKKTWFPAVSICFCFMFRCLSPSVLSSGLLRRRLRWLRWWSLPGPGAAPRPGLCYVMNVICQYVSHIWVITKHYINHIMNICDNNICEIYVSFMASSWVFPISYTLIRKPTNQENQAKTVKGKLSHECHEICHFKTCNTWLNTWLMRPSPVTPGHVAWCHFQEDLDALMRLEGTILADYHKGKPPSWNLIKSH